MEAAALWLGADDESEDGELARKCSSIEIDVGLADTVIVLGLLGLSSAETVCGAKRDDAPKMGV